MKKRTLTALFAVTALSAAMMAGCAGKAEKTEATTAAEASSEAETEAETTAEETTAEAEAEDEENYDTGDASMDNTRNQDEIGDKELMVVSFGTSFNDSRRLTIGAIENAMASTADMLLRNDK